MSLSSIGEVGGIGAGTMFPISLSPISCIILPGIRGSMRNWSKLEELEEVGVVSRCEDISLLTTSSPDCCDPQRDVWIDGREVMNTSWLHSWVSILGGYYTVLYCKLIYSMEGVP